MFLLSSMIIKIPSVRGKRKGNYCCGFSAQRKGERRGSAAISVAFLRRLVISFSWRFFQRREGRTQRLRRGSQATLCDASLSHFLSVFFSAEKRRTQRFRRDCPDAFRD